MNRKPKILVVGSFVMDQIARTSVFPRQGQTVLGNAFSKAPGGKGANQAVQMARLGADVTFCGKLGHDGNGEEMLAMCKDVGIHTQHVLFDETAASGCSVIILEEQPGKPTENRILVIPGANMTITPEDVAFLREEVANYDLVVLQLEIPMEINTIVAQYAKAKGVPVMLNSAPSAPLPKELLACLTYISPNEHEAEDLTGVHIPHEGQDVDMDAVTRAAAALHETGVERVIITLGSAGAVLSDKDGLHFSPSVKGVNVVDPTAAGDSFVGAFCTAACTGMGAEEALRFANHTAALTVAKMGAMPSLPTLAEVKATLPWTPDLHALEG